MKKAVLPFLTFLLLSLLVAHYEVYVYASPRIIKVPVDYPTIQQAINAANATDMIWVASGTYYEHLIINKSLSLIGENQPIIDGAGHKTVIEVTADEVEVKGFTVQNGTINGIGVYSQNNVIMSNTIKSNFIGVYLENSDRNIVSDNIITSNIAIGVHLLFSFYNTISGNNVSNNYIGINLYGSLGNSIYHNNFISNIEQVYLQLFVVWPPNNWDTLAGEGNYWSDYRGLDENGDGIGDTQLPHQEVDYYPLMNSWFSGNAETRIFDPGWGYNVTTFSNSSIVGFNFSQILRNIGFKLSSPLNATGFCNITIRNILLSSPYVILLDDSPLDWVETANGTHSSLYFAYTFGAHKVEIIGTKAIPEFPSTLSLLLSMLFILATIVIGKRGKFTKEAKYDGELNGRYTP